MFRFLFCAFVHLFVFVKSDVQDFPVTDGNTGMATLMALIAIMTAERMDAVSVNAYLIDGANTDAATSEWF